MMNWARICKLFKEPRNRFPTWRAGTGQPYLSYRPARPQYIGRRNRFLGCISVYKYGLRVACGAGRSVTSWRRAAVWAERPVGTAGRRWAAHPHLTSTRQATQKTTAIYGHSGTPGSGHVLQRYYTEENSKHIFPEKELCGLNSYIHYSVCD